MSTEKKFRHSKLTELGKIQKQDGMDYHFRSSAMEDGTAGLVYGDKNAGPDDPYLLILDFLMEAGEVVKYYARANSTSTGTLVFIELDRASLPALLKKYQAAQAGAAVHTAAGVIPPPGAVTPPPAPKAEHPGVIAPPPAGQGSTIPGERIKPATENPFPTQPPPENTKGGGKGPLDDPYYGYPNRNAMLDAKDNYFRWLEKYKMQRDVLTDREFSWRFYLELATKIVTETGKKLQPSDLADVAWPLAVTMYNRYQSLKFDQNGQILPDGSSEAEQPA